MTCDKHGCDSEEVLSEFGGSFKVFVCTVNHEFDASLSKEVFQEVCGKARQSVFLHNDNFTDQALVDSVQQGAQAFPLEDKSRRDALDDFVRWVGRNESAHLSSEIFSCVNAGSSPNMSARATNFTLHSCHACSFPSNGRVLMFFSAMNCFRTRLVNACCVPAHLWCTFFFLLKPGDSFAFHTR